MFRLHTDATDSTTTLRLQGRLTGDHVDALEAALDATTTTRADLVIDIEGLHFADAAGVQCLRRACARGARLHHASAFLRHLLEL